MYAPDDFARAKGVELFSAEMRSAWHFKLESELKAADEIRRHYNGTA